MLSQLLLLATAASSVLAQNLTLAKSFTGWDCCKPICATGGNNNNLLNSRGMVKVCDKNSKVMDQQSGLRANSGCTAGSAYICDDFQPMPVSEDLSYGFAIQVSDTQVGDNPNCCKCYEIEWLSGNAEGKKMIAQIVTPGGAGNGVKKNDLIILTPGGGLGPLNQGCKAQYGGSFDWGKDYGGVTGRDSCEKLPGNLQGGCYWRFNWARGDVTGWDIVYKQIQCPSRLTSISGCEARL